LLRIEFCNCTRYRQLIKVKRWTANWPCPARRIWLNRDKGNREKQLLLPMPVYEYECTKCGKKFSQTERMSEHGKKKCRCPKCNSTKVVQRISTFFAITSKKS